MARRTPGIATLSSLVLVCSSGYIYSAPIREIDPEPISAPIPDGQSPQTGFLTLGAYSMRHAGEASAKPGGSGSALMRYQIHTIDAAHGDRLKFLADLTFLTDRLHRGAFSPVSLDYLLGVRSCTDNAQIQISREEDFPFKRDFSYQYWDARTSILFGDPKFLAGSLMVANIFHNRTMPARMDGSGLAFMRYGGHLQGNLLNNWLLLRGDVDLVSDRDYRRYSPADMETSLGLGTRFDGADFFLYRQTRQSMDRSGYATYFLFTMQVPFDENTLISPSGLQQ